MRMILIFLVSLIFISCDSLHTATVFSSDSDEINAKADLSIKYYQSCDDLRSDILQSYHTKQMMESKRDHSQDFEDVAMPSIESKSSEESAESITNNQESGIDESDILKATPSQIFFVKDYTVQVIDRVKKQVVGSIKLEGYLSSQAIHHINIKLQTYKNRLIIQGTLSSLESNRIEVFQTYEGQMPEKLWSIELKGQVRDSRLFNGHIFTISQYQDTALEEFASKPDQAVFPFKEEKHTSLKMTCDSIVKNPYPTTDTTITTVSSINIMNGKEELKLENFIGTSNAGIYMGPTHIILADEKPYWLQEDNQNESSSVLTRINYDANSGELNTIGRAEVIGIAQQEQWSFKELSPEYTAVVTTSENPIENYSAAYENHENGRNHLFILSGSENGLHVESSNINFGKPREDVRSVRFVNDYAYVVTFRTTDPLYSFNLKDPLRPTMEDALEIPGFSSYMHPIGNDLMIGLGFSDASRHQTQLNLFDVSINEDLTQLDRKVFGQQFSSSEASENHHAFFFDEETGIFGFPLITDEYPDNSKDQLTPNTDEGYNSYVPSAVIMSVKKDQATTKIQELARLSHKDLLDDENVPEQLEANYRETEIRRISEIRRIFRDGDSIATVSEIGIKFHDHQNGFEVTKIIKFIK